MKRNRNPDRGATFRRRVLAVAVSQALVASASAATLVVDTLADGTGTPARAEGGQVQGNGCTLRDAIVKANLGGAVTIPGSACVDGDVGPDTIQFAASLAGTITLINGELAITDDLTISGPGSSQLFVSGGLDDGVLATQAGIISISGLTLENGSRANGGAIQNNATLTLTEVVVRNSSANSDGGGIYNGGNLTLTRSTVSGNSAAGSAGGITNFGVLLIEQGSTLVGNTAGVGGGGVLNGGSLTLTDSTISGNTATQNGGGIGNLVGGTISLLKSTVQSNTADSHGGGVYSRGTVTITGSTISGNTAGIYGGAVSNEGGTVTLTGSLVSANQASYETLRNSGNQAAITLTNSTVSGNTANAAAGLHLSSGARGLVQHSTFSFNGPNSDGPTVYAFAGTDLQMVNSIVANSTGRDCEVMGTFSVNRYNLIEDGGCTVNAVGLLAGDPFLAGLEDNGGPTQTLALDDGSPAIDSADPESCQAFDQRGVPRLGEVCDRGAYEFFNGQLVGTLEDTVVPDGACSLREAIDNANKNSAANTDCSPGVGVDTITFPESLAGATIKLTQGELVISDDLTLAGPGSQRVTLDGGQASRILHLANPGAPDDPLATVNRIENLVLMNGDASAALPRSEGGAIRSMADLTVTDTIITGNTAGLGGGMHSAGTVSLTQTTINGNSASLGGGISSLGTVTLTQSTINGNSATMGGGGIFNDSGTVSLTGSTIIQNTADLTGGGVHSAGGTLTVTDTTITGNTATSEGGGVNSDGSSLTIVGSTISGNTANASGGGLYTSGNSVTITNSTITGNTADSSGGGIYNSSSLSVVNATISGNTAPGLSSAPGFGVNLFSSVVSGSMAPVAGRGVSAPIADLEGMANISQSLIENPGTAVLTGDIPIVLPPDLGPLQDNGGGILTQAPLPGSPLIDAGNPNSCSELDQIGNPRYDGDGDGSTVCDIGAVEFVPPEVFKDSFEDP